MPPPRVDAHTAPWWEAASQHRLTVQRCVACGANQHPPTAICRSCHGVAFEWPETSTTGRVIVATVVHRPFLPVLAEYVPYTVAVVALDAPPGVELVTNIVGSDPTDVRPGLRVEAIWEDMSAEVAIPRFRVCA